MGNRQVLFCWSLLFCLLAGMRTVVGDDYIFHGETAQSGAIPYQVGVYRKKGNDIEGCGGVIVSARHVLTAAHCVVDFKDNGTVKTPVRQLTIVAGSPRIMTGQIYYVLTSTPHPDYEARDEDLDENIEIHSDIALLTLYNKINFTSKIQAARLPQRPTARYVGRKMTVAGWGIMETRQRPKDLKVARDVVIQSECGGIRNTNFCAIGQNGEAFCGGDSGSPGVVDKNIVVGIVSHINRSCSEEGAPQFYTDVYHFVETGWLCSAGLKEACRAAHDHHSQDYQEEEEDEEEQDDHDQADQNEEAEEDDENNAELDENEESSIVQT